MKAVYNLTIVVVWIAGSCAPLAPLMHSGGFMEAVGMTILTQFWAMVLYGLWALGAPLCLLWR